MKKKIVVSVAALLLVGAGAIYAFGSGYVPFGEPTQEQLDVAVSQAAESAAQQTAEELAQSSAAQAKELEELRQQVEQLNEALAETEDAATPSPTSEMQVVQVPSPASAESKPVAAESKPAPVSSTPPAKVQNVGTVFDEYTVTVTDKKTPAVRAAGTDWPITSYYFISASGEHLGSITGNAMNGIMKKYEAALSANEEWEFWFAEQFNSYRGLSGIVGGANPSSTPQLENPSSKAVDLDAYADEVIALINQKRQNKGLNALEIDDSLMSHSVVRAEELSIQYSHVRPNGTKEKSECIVMRRDTPAAAVQSWMDSDPHRDAILNESGRFNYSSIGAGCYQDEAGVLYWVITFGGNSQSNQETNANAGSTSSKGNSTATYSISETELFLTAGEEHQLSIESTSSDDFTVSWSGPSIGKNTLSIDDSGYIITFRRSGTDSAKATLTVTAKVSVNGKTVKTLSCKVTVTQ